jgi:hypothetical protein
MAKYYVFRGMTGTAEMVTDDRTGAKLPKHPVGSWVFSKEIYLEPGEHRIGASSDDIIAGVAKDGYYRWPQPDSNEKE